MTADGAGIAPFYDQWWLVNDRLIDTVRGLTPEQLALREAAYLPIWAIAAHIAGPRVYWLCHILGEPGAAATPFADPSGDGWEDDLDRPRTGEELAGALESTWRIVEDCLARWTPDMLSQEFPRPFGDAVQMHTRQSVLMRLITHDAYHCGEISLILGMHGLPEIDLWRGRARIVPAPVG